MLFLQGARDLYAEPELLNPLITLLARSGNSNAAAGRGPLLPRAGAQPVHRQSNQRRHDQRARGLDRCGSSPVTLLGELVRASQRVGATAARRVKVSELAALLKSLTPDEIDIGVHYLSGEIPQGKIGIGYATVRAGRIDPGRGIGDAVDRRSRRPSCRNSPTCAAADRLRGAQRRCRSCSRVRLLPEQQFLLRLLIGELRQGALAGVMVDAIAAAAELPAAPVRRAAMYSKSLGIVAVGGAARGNRGAGEIPARTVLAGVAHAGADGRRRGRSPARKYTARRRSSGRWTARAFRCTSSGTTCAFTRAA